MKENRKNAFNLILICSTTIANVAPTPYYIENTNTNRNTIIAMASIKP